MTLSARLRRLTLLSGALALAGCSGDDSSAVDESSSGGDDDDDDDDDGPATGSDTSGVDPDGSSTSSGGADTGTTDDGGPTTTATVTNATETGTSTGESDTESGTSTGELDTGTDTTPTGGGTTDPGGEAVCLETTSNCAAPQDDCVCVGCNVDGECLEDDDCVCPDCDGTEFCLPTDCDANGVCNPFFEGCACSDCYAHPECADNPQPCGDGEIAEPEECEGADLAGQDCASLGFTEGVLSCSSNCFFDTSMCIESVGCNDDGMCGDDDDCVCSDCDAQAFCGPFNCNFDDLCDPFNEGCACTDCYPHPECADNPQCGDGVIEGSEECEGDDLAGQDCVGLGFTGGTLACDAFCGLDTSACTVPAEWSCPPQFYLDGSECDCGCGAFDPDCADATVASCLYCNDPGSCDADGMGCPGDIDPLDNTQCV